MATTLNDQVLDLRFPTDDKHRRKFRAGAILPDTVASVDMLLQVPRQYRLIYDQEREGACLPAGTLVRMADGTHRAIEAIRILDQVVTAEGRTGTVLQTMARPVNESIIGLRLRGHRHLQLTANHPLLTECGYVPAGKLQPGMRVAMTRYMPPRSETAMIPRLRRVEMRGERAGIINAGGVATAVIAPPEKLTLSSELGELIGLFLAEGSTTENKVVWSFGGHERDTLVERTKALIAQSLGAEARIQRRPNGVYKVVLYGKHWRTIFQSWFQLGPYDKAIPGAIWAGGEPFLRSVLTGWLAGDGYHRRTTTHGTTVSHRLVMDMYSIAAAIGLRPTIRRSEPKGRRVRWDLEYGIAGAGQDDTYRTVEAVDQIPFAGFVFNIHVQGDESYVAEGIGVHNCVGFSQSWMQSILNRTKYDAIWLYREAQKVDEWDDTPPQDGTSLRAGFDVLRTRGHRQLRGLVSRPEDLQHGITANRWASTVDEIRTAISEHIPVNFGINWYRQFSSPKQLPRLDDEGFPLTEFGIQRYDWWIGRNDVQWGPVDGGHAITCVGASDLRQAFALCNTWGYAYPFLVWLPYDAMTRLLTENGEAGIVTDR